MGDELALEVGSGGPDATSAGNWPYAPQTLERSPVRVCLEPLRKLSPAPDCFKPLTQASRGA